MSVDLGCSPAYGNGPSRLLCPSACVIGAPVQSSTLRAPQSEPGIWEGCATRTSMGPPPQAGRLELELDTWQDSPLRRNKALPTMITHRSTKLGTLAQRRGMVGKGGRTNTHTRTAPAANLRAKAHSADALVAANTRTVSPWRVGRCLTIPDGGYLIVNTAVSLSLLLRSSRSKV